jgi:hypothetical protein
MNYLPLNLTIAGVLLLGLGILHIALPGVLQWNRELAGASQLNREVSYVHSLLQPSPVARLVLIGAVAFWASRLAIQLLVFNRHARESPSWCALSIAGTGLWLYLTAVWTLALITQCR